MYHTVDRAIREIKAELDYQMYMTPSNFHSENQRFLEHYDQGLEYNPQYQYIRFDKKDQLLARLQGVESQLLDADTGIGRILTAALTSLKREINMYDRIGDDDAFTPCSDAVCGMPDQAYLDAAWALLRNMSTPDPEDACYSAEQLRDIMAERLAAYGFD